jgi:hypothetical protein
MGQVLSWLPRLRSRVIGAGALYLAAGRLARGGPARFVTPHDFQNASVFEVVKSTRT